MQRGTDADKIDPMKQLRESVRRGRAMSWPNYRRLCQRQRFRASRLTWGRLAKGTVEHSTRT